MKRGEVWWVNFPPLAKGEIKKERPAVIVSNDSANKFLNRLQVIPLSTNVQKIYPSEAVVVLKGKKNKAMADQLTTADKSRLSNLAGRLSPSDMKKVEQAIKLQLGLMP